MSKKGRKRRQASGLRPHASEPRNERSSRSPTPEARGPAPQAPEAPAFWFGFEVAWAKLAIGRVLLFGMLAIDALMQIRHAPRYGAGGFNVGQLGIFDALGPTRGSYEVCELINAYLLILIACGVGTRIALPIVAAIYSWLYFGSQLDSYQHHYLVALLLWLACFVPWERPDGARADTPVRSWGLRLMLVQVAIMYVWAAISKMNPAWWDGSTLGQQITGSLRSLIDHTVGIRMASRMVIPVELTLACTVWNRRAWPIAAPLGLLFHLGIVASGLEIGLFAWLMIAFYAFVIPDVVWTTIARFVTVKLPDVTRARWIVWALAFVLAIVLAAVTRFEHTIAVAIVLAIAFGGATLAALVRGRPALAWLAAAHLLAFATWFTVDRATTVASDYYLFWGGSARRLGDTESAMNAYEHLVAISPDNASGHYHLGQLWLAHDRSDDGLAELHAAEALDPHHARAFVAEAEWLAAHGRRDEALTKVREAEGAEPTDPDVRRLVGALQHR
jgi:hypothetical protein